MSPQRAIHEFRSWSFGAKACLGFYRESLGERNSALIDARLSELERLIKATDVFKPTMEQINEWSKERRAEAKWPLTLEK